MVAAAAARKNPRFELPVFPTGSVSPAKQGIFDDDLQCGICFERFDDELRAPIGAAGCRHSICRTCLRNMAAHSRARMKAFRGACPTCLNGRFERNQEPHILSIALVQKIQTMEAGRSRRILRGDKFAKDPLLSLRKQRTLREAAACVECVKMEGLQDQVRILKSQNDVLWEEKMEHTGEKAKLSIIEDLLKGAQRSLAKLKDEHQSQTAILNDKDSLIAELQKKLKWKQNVIDRTAKYLDKTFAKLVLSKSSNKKLSNSLTRIRQQTAKQKISIFYVYFLLHTLTAMSAIHFFGGFGTGLIRQMWAPCSKRGELPLCEAPTQMPPGPLL